MVAYAEKLERLRASKLPDLPGLNVLENLFRKVTTARQAARANRYAARMIAIQKLSIRKNPLGYRNTTNYALDLPRDNGIPVTNTLYGKWLFLHELDWPRGPSPYTSDGNRIYRSFSILGGGPFTPTPKQRAWREDPTDIWFRSPQDEFGGRRPCDVIREDGLAGAIDVGQALDRMGPEGPPLVIKQRIWKR